MKAVNWFVVLTTVYASLGAQAATTPKPVMRFPANHAVLTTNQVSVSGSTTARSGVTNVQYTFNGAGPFTASQPNTNNWNEWDTPPLALVAGSNTFQVWAIGTNGISKTNTEDFFLEVKSTIVVTVVGNGRVVPDLNGRELVIDRSYTMVALPGAGQIFAGWSGTVSSDKLVLNFTMQAAENLTATFEPSPFTNGLVGVYDGLFYDNANLSEATAGYFTMTLAGSGGFSGDIMLDGQTKFFSGRLDANGQTQLTVERPHRGDLSLTLSLDLINSNGLSGTISSPGTNQSTAFSATLIAYQQTHKAAAYAGYYTLAMAGAGVGTGGPEGYSYGTATVSRQGETTITLNLSDHATTLAVGQITTGGWFPLYASLNGQNGSLSGWLRFNTNGLTLSMMDWFKNPTHTDGIYSNGFSVTGLSLVLDPYKKGTNAFGSSNAVVTLAGGDLAGALTDIVTLNEKAVLSGTNTNSVAISLNLSTGVFTGTFTDPTDDHAKTPIQGVIIQQQPEPEGYGFFTSTNNVSGNVTVSRP